MNSFILNIKSVFRKHNTYDFYKSLRESLSTNEPALSDLFDDLEDNYCEGGKLLGKDIYLGGIYMFVYDQKEPSQYGNKQVIKFKDPSPMLLVTAQDDKFIRGINLNLCTGELRTLILNIMTNLDEKFYDGGFVSMCNQGKKPLSDKVLQFMAKDGEKQIIQALKRHFENVDYGAIFRTYRKEKIKLMKFIEYYVWPYIPGIEYKGIPAEVMKLFWKASGISTIKI